MCSSTRFKPALAWSTFMVLATAFAGHTAQAITLTPVATGFNNPIGIDHHHPTNRVVMSVNYPSGTPYNFELVAANGTRVQFSAIAGFSDEVKIATAKDDGGGTSLGGFTAGELFTGTGMPGVVARISANGGSVQNPWVTLPGETGIMRGSLYVDRTGVFGGDLIVVTTAGGVWRINSAGSSTLLANLGTHLEGLVTVPNDAARYGPWAGKILAGAEGQGRLYTVAPDGSTAFYELGINPEDIDIVPANENFFGVDFSGQTLWGAAAGQWTSLVGDIVIAQEFPGILWRVQWNGFTFVASSLTQVTQWEHVTFSSAGVPCVPPVCSIIGDTEICAGTTTQLCGPEAEGAGYAWTGPDGPVANTRCVSVGTAGKYTLTITVPCRGSDPVSTSCSATLVLDPCNQPPDCSRAVACESVLWPPNHKYRPVSICGVTDPDGDPVTITVTNVTQDEPINTRGDGNTCPDAQIVDGRASVRAERTGTPGIPGNGRVYRIEFTAEDGRGGRCTGAVFVCVPHDLGHPTCVDDGQRYSSLGPCSSGEQVAPEALRLEVGEIAGTRANLVFALPAEADVDISVFDVSGRRIATIEKGHLAQGVYERAWNMDGVSNGLYFVRMRAGNALLTAKLIRAR